VTKQRDTFRDRAAARRRRRLRRPSADQIVQQQAYQAELRKDQNRAAPTITFEKSYLLKIRRTDLHIDFDGNANTRDGGGCLLPAKACDCKPGRVITAL